MPVTPPSYGVAYAQAEQNTNIGTVCGFIDTNATAISGQGTKLTALYNFFVTFRASVARDDGSKEGSAKDALLAACDTCITALT